MLMTPVALNIEWIKRQIEHELEQAFTWHYSTTTDSTNSDLLNKSQANSIAISEYQTQGRGQYQRQWHSQAGENLLFSIAIERNTQEPMSILPIKVGLAIQSALTALSYPSITLKWPNDIYYQGKKLGGVLIESLSQGNKSLMVVGVGLNINSSYDESDASIALKQQQSIKREPILVECIKQILSQLHNNQSDVINDFNQYHLFHLKPIHFTTAHGTSEGVCKGINEQGQLIIETQNGLETHSTGSIEVTHHAVS